MVDVLAKMDSDKKERLILSAFEEFGENSFKKASTNVIVKKAGISKGLLYHYFNNKQALFDYLVEFALVSVAEPLSKEVGLKDTDILNRISRMVKLKLEILSRYPSLLSFSKTMFEGMDYEKIMKVIAKYSPIPIDAYYQSNIDASLFKEGVDIKMAINNIQWTLEKISETYVNKRAMAGDFSMPFEPVTKEVNDYLAHFRQIYYK